LPMRHNNYSSSSPARQPRRKLNNTSYSRLLKPTRYSRPRFDTTRMDRLAAGLDVVGPQCSEIANVELATSDDWVGKRSFRIRSDLFLLRLGRRSEATLLAICLRRRFYQRNFSVNAVQIQMPIGVG